MNIAIIPNRDKPDALAAAEQVYGLLKPRAAASILLNPTHADLLQFAPDLVVVLGGDGSILSIAQSMAGIRAPVAGINFGKLGYLAAFSLEQFLQHMELILAGKAPTTERLMLRGTIYRRQPGDGIQDLKTVEDSNPLGTGFALNDIVINAGDPFRMIELDVQINEHETATFRSDGVIVATASGSTGYNLSAGGPLMAPDVPAIVLTAICPHSLSFRPVVVSQASVILVNPHRLNSGSKVNFDGQLTRPFTEDDCLLIRVADVPLKLVENPATSHWQMLAQKLHWARSPKQS